MVARVSGAHETGSGMCGERQVVGAALVECLQAGSSCGAALGPGWCCGRALRAVRQRETSDDWGGTGDAGLLRLYTMDAAEGAQQRRLTLAARAHALGPLEGAVGAGNGAGKWAQWSRDRFLAACKRAWSHNHGQRRAWAN